MTVLLEARSPFFYARTYACIAHGGYPQWKSMRTIIFARAQKRAVFSDGACSFLALHVPIQNPCGFILQASTTNV